MGDIPSQLVRRALPAPAADALVEHAAFGVVAGLPLEEVFLALAEDADDRRLRVAAGRIAAALRDGATLSAALATAAGQLPPYLERALAASSDADQTAAMLAGLARHESARRRLRRKVRAAMFYPAIVLTCLVLVFGGIAVLVLPEIEPVLLDMDVGSAPLTTSIFAIARWAAWALAGLAAGVLVLAAGLRIRATARVIHWLRGGIPLLGPLWTISAQHEFASVLGALVEQRVPLVDALACTAASLRDRNLARSTRIATAKCENGAMLSMALADSIHFAPALPALVGWGETQGSLPESLGQAAAAFEEELDLQASLIQRVMPPTLFLGVFLLIFLLVAGLLIPLIWTFQSYLTWTSPPRSPWQEYVNQTGVVPLSATLLAMGACLHVSLRILYGARGPTPDDVIFLLMRILAWGLTLLPLIMLAVAGAAWLSVVLFAAILEAGYELVLARRAAQRQSTWRLIAGALAAARPLGDVLRVHQNRFTGAVGRAVRRLVQDLRQGMPWDAAVWKNRRAVPRLAPAFAALAATSARPVRVARDLDDLADPAMQRLQHQTVQRFVYLATVTLALLAVLIHYCIYVAPQLPAVFGEYDVQGPFIVQFVGGLTQAVANAAGPMEVIGDSELPLRATLAAALLIVGLLLFGGLYLAGVPVLRPLTDRLTMFWHRSRVMQLLAAAIEQGQPVDAALTQLCHNRTAYPSRTVRRRIAAVRKLVVSGGEWQDCLWRTRLIGESDVVVLRSAQAAGNLPWALRLMAARKVRLALFRLTLLQQALFVGLALVFGLAVLLIGAAVLTQISAAVISVA